MNECKKFKDLILTDYFDGEIEPITKQEIDSHLHSCSDCRLFAEEIEKSLIAPFQEIKREKVPANIWPLIQERIQKEETWYEKARDFVGKMLQTIFSPSAVPVLATMTIFVMVGTFYLYNLQVKQVKEKEQGEYLAYVLESTDNSPGENVGSDTPIETYFL